MSTRTTLRFNTILGTARYAATVIREGSEDAQGALILAVAALESFVQEFAWMLESNTFGAMDDPQLILLGDTLIELEKSRAQLLDKIRMSYRILTGVALGKGETSYQNLALLVRIRNELVHPKVVSVDLRAPDKKPGREFVRGLVSRGVLRKSAEASDQVWTRDVLVPEVAAWSVNTAHAGMTDLVSRLPVSCQAKVILESRFDQFEPLQFTKPAV